ncbi:glucose-1-phosphate adenylyltransferase family protein [Thermodesulfatator autotrophicus]|uniref:Glucose-1-phosphate adenylyltransferase n=1 Tax=Thermodesulfatator autotrophicus TaxID=1795632 RepID=A0A177E9N4_9BACT|nr:glucose-1-phosphate adenylyltransferase family protein [Thermodesulfatator autotrophicus]OAG28120.1 glucose-1-phosphate adenylyltransferase [Thermodesulfatator autotrophicus]
MAKKNIPVLAMILAGGRVDELSVLTFYRPKASLPFGGVYRVIDFPLTNLMRSGFFLVGVLSQYRPYSLMEHLDYGIPWDMTGRRRGIYILPPFRGREASDWYKGTADAVYQNLEFIKRWSPEVVLILSGDHIYRMDYRPFLDFHLQNKADVTIAFTPVKEEEAHRFGQGVIEEVSPFGGPLKDYREKVSPPVSTCASLTIYAFRPEVLEEVLLANVGEDSHEFGRDILPRMLGAYRMYGYIFRGYWGYTRTVKEYWQTNMDLLGPEPKIDLKRWQICTNLAHREVRDRKPTILGTRANICDSLFYNGSFINGEVHRSVLFPGVVIEEGAEVSESILFYGTVVKRGARLKRVICDAGVTIEEETQVGGEEDITVIGTKTSVPSGLKIAPGAIVYPNLKKEDFSQVSYPAGEIVS